MAKQQSVIGLVAAGIEHVRNLRTEKDISLVFARHVIQLELRNKEMNVFVAMLFDSTHNNNNISAILLKGQGVAQCYERPLWRESGDVDMFFKKEDYAKAIECLAPLASFRDNKAINAKHFEIKIGEWDVEIQGCLVSSFSSKINFVLNEIMNETFHKGEIRYWENYGVQIPLLSADNDAIYVFFAFSASFF